MDLSTLLKFFPSPLREFITAQNVSDVMVNADGSVYLDQNGRIAGVENVAVNSQQLLLGIQNIARQMGRDLDGSQPILDARLPDGSRVAAVLSHDELSVTIRKFNRWYSYSELCEAGTVPHEASTWLADAIAQSRNILVSGGTGSGKTTLSKALLDMVPETERLIVIEKPREVAISHPNAVRWEARDATKDRPAITVAQLVAAALRHRPDRIVIGEVREPEAAYDLLQAMNTGHSGTLSTIHADRALDALYRLSDLALASHSNLSAEFVRAQVARAIHYVVHVQRGPDGKRCVTELQRVRGYGKNGFQSESLYEKEEALCHS